MRRADRRPSSRPAAGRRPPARDPAAAVPMVLIVDDDPDAQAIYGSYLSSLGCVVFSAHDGVEAVEKASRLRPDLIVMDLAMPHLDGSGAIARLKDSGRTERIPIIVLSGADTAGEVARRAGCEAFLAKPCVPELLWWQIRLLLELFDEAPPACPS